MSDSEFLLTVEAAKMLRLAAGTLQNWRVRGEGPPFIRLGGRVLYDRTALVDWARNQTTITTTETTEASSA
jgi:hypothetical protein